MKSSRDLTIILTISVLSISHLMGLLHCVAYSPQWKSFLTQLLSHTVPFGCYCQFWRKCEKVQLARGCCPDLNELLMFSVCH